jgi:hypothetical protein
MTTETLAERQLLPLEEFWTGPEEVSRENASRLQVRERIA